MNTWGFSNREYLEILSKINRGHGNIMDYIQECDGYSFEKLCGQLLRKMGYKVEITKKSNDGGIDIIATLKTPLILSKSIIQCKRYSGRVSVSTIRELYGVLLDNNANAGVLITSGYFSKDAKQFATDKPIELIDGNQLANLLEEYDLVEDNSEKNSYFNNEFIETFCADYYDEYERLFATESCDKILRSVQRIEFCYYIIIYQLCLFNITNGEIGDCTVGSICRCVVNMFTDMIDRELSYFSDLENSDSIQGKNIFLHLQVIHLFICILKNEFILALEHSLNLEKRIRELYGTSISSGDVECGLFYARAVSSVITILKLINCEQFIPIIENKRDELLVPMRESIRMTSDIDEFARITLQKIRDCEKDNQIITLDKGNIILNKNRDHSLLSLYFPKNDNCLLSDSENCIMLEISDSNVILKCDFLNEFVDANNVKRFILVENGVDEKIDIFERAMHIVQKYLS